MESAAMALLETLCAGALRLQEFLLGCRSEFELTSGWRNEWTTAYLALAAIICITLILCLRRHHLANTVPVARFSKDSVDRGDAMTTSELWTQLFDLAKTSFVRVNMERLVGAIESRGIDVNSYRDPQNGLTLLLCACLSGDGQLVSYLLGKGADPTAMTLDRDSSLLLATYACCSLKSADPSLLDQLACRGLNTNTRNSHGDTALSIAALHGCSRVISILLQYGADPNIPNNGGILPIDLARTSGDPEAMSVLESHMHGSYGYNAMYTHEE